MIYRQTKKSAGADLSAREDTSICAGEIVLVPTGFFLPELTTSDNIFYLLAARSSLAYKKGLLLANGVGIVDFDYKEEIQVMLYNSTKETVVIPAGERIAQLIPTTFVPIFPSLASDRIGGFGSTGK